MSLTEEQIRIEEAIKGAVYRGYNIYGLDISSVGMFFGGDAPVNYGWLDPISKTTSETIDESLAIGIDTSKQLSNIKARAGNTIGALVNLALELNDKGIRIDDGIIGFMLRAVECNQYPYEGGVFDETIEEIYQTVINLDTNGGVIVDGLNTLTRSSNGDFINSDGQIAIKHRWRAVSYRWGGDPHGPHPSLRDSDPIVSSCPLILDLDGDGVEADAITYFDHEGDGWAELSAWAGEDDGTLVWDRNNDGVINDGSELFGDSTVLANGRKAANGFAALADLDSNGDGVVDASDTALAELQVMRWTDDNNNGMKDDGEKYLVTLDSLDIESLNAGFANSNHVDSSGNEHRQVGSYTQTDSLADFRIPPLVELRKITLNHGFSREQFGRYRALG